MIIDENLLISQLPVRMREKDYGGRVAISLFKTALGYEYYLNSFPQLLL